MEKEQTDYIRRDQISDDKTIQKRKITFLRIAFNLFTSKKFLKQGFNFALVGAIGTFSERA